MRCYCSRDLQDATGTLEKVVLERIPTSHIADKRQMFDHFIRVSALYKRKSAHAFLASTAAPYFLSPNVCIYPRHENVWVRQLNTLYDAVARAREYQLQDRARQQNDFEQVRLAEQALQFWTSMMEEDYEHELACAVSLQGLQVRFANKKHT